MRDVLERIKILILGRHFDAAAPTICSEKISAVGIWTFCPVDLDCIIVKALIERSLVAGPRAIFTLRKGTAVSETYSNALGLRCNDAKFDSPFRVYLLVFLSLLIGWRRLPVIDWRRVILGITKLAGYD